MVFEKASFEDVEEAIRQLRNTIAIDHGEGQNTQEQQRIQCSAQCNAQNQETWGCNAFYFPNLTSCAMGFIPLEYALKFKKESADDGGQHVYVIKF